jgi:tetratricopeptide (TPR) repeat protein
LKEKPDEVEARTLLGEVYIEYGDPQSAQKAFEKAVEIDPKYDFASRSLKRVDYIILERKNPEKANILKKQTSEENLSRALLLVQQHASPDLSDILDKIKISFSQTDSLSGHKNIAQYEHRNRKIVITDEYIWSAPEVTAAYIIHEAVHAKDKDGISSIREEQDAYAESIKFWINHSNGIKDPELDYAAKLYKENPQKLRIKVGETYRARDESMPMYSPHHTPENLGLIASIKIQTLKITNKISNMVGLS